MASPEVAAFLREALGPIRAWDDCLADMRAGKTNVFGHTLEPFHRARDDKAYRPFYRLDDVMNFARKVHASNPNARPGIGYRIHKIDFDPTDRRSWKARKYKLCA